MAITSIDLARVADTRIRELASAAYPHEGCGVLLGHFTADGASIVEATSGRNLNTERAHDRYLLDPADIIRADRDARARGLDVLGYWHSHPDHPAWPSQFDTDHAWVDYVYLIIRTEVGGAGDLNGFTLTDEGGSFDQLPLTVTAVDDSQQ